MNLCYAVVVPIGNFQSIADGIGFRVFRRVQFVTRWREALHPVIKLHRVGELILEA